MLLRCWSFSFIFIVLISLTLAGTVLGQDEPRNYRTSDLEKHGVTRRARTQQNTLQFNNINLEPYYYNKRKLKKVDRMERKGRTADELRLLREYISEFGIQNFYKDTFLMWRLGQLYQKVGDNASAIEMYRLVLKHHRGDVTKVKQYYDSLTINDRPKYVPLKYYYELVDFRKQIDTLRPPRGVLINMGSQVNSDAADYAPFLSVDNKLLIFSSKRKRVGQFNIKSDEDIYTSQGYDDGWWDDAQPLKQLNTSYNEGSAVLTRDGRTVYFSRCMAPDSYGNCDLYTATMTDDSVWRDVRNMGININSRGWDSQPSLSQSEDTLYFASDRIGGFGLSDVYYTYKNKKGEWQRARNIGPVINSRNNEVSPYFHPKYNVLYFSSNGHLLNFGDFDIYKTYSVNGIFQEPLNIGPLVNGEGSEYYFTIDKNAKDLYYAKSKGGDLENLDLYSFPLPMEAQPLSNTSFAGSLTDSVTGEPFSGIVTIIDLDNGIEVAPQFLKTDGSFEFDLLNQNNYLLVIQGDEFFRVEQNFYLEGDTVIQVSTPALKFKKWKFASLEFENGSAEILEYMETDLFKLVNFMLDNPTFSLKISGHTDSQGNPDSNLKLSQARAGAIRAFMVDRGLVDANRIEAMGYGSYMPIVEEETEEDRRLNRRVEFEIIKPGEESGAGPTNETKMPDDGGSEMGGWEE